MKPHRLLLGVMLLGRMLWGQVDDLAAKAASGRGDQNIGHSDNLKGGAIASANQRQSGADNLEAAKAVRPDGAPDQVTVSTRTTTARIADKEKSHDLPHRMWGSGERLKGEAMTQIEQLIAEIAELDPAIEVGDVLWINCLLKIERSPLDEQFFCGIGFLLIFFGLWNFKFGNNPPLGVLSILVGSGFFFYGFILVLQAVSDSM